MQINKGATIKPQQKKIKQVPTQAIAKQKRVLDPQVVLYQEMDFKVALSNISLDKKSLFRRKSHQNYLAYNEPFDINILLDEKYWKHKRSKFVHSEEEFSQLCVMNKKEQVGTFQEDVYHDFFNFQYPAESKEFRVQNLHWQNNVDLALPYQSGFKEHFWVVSSIK